jgi:predicted enzyme related to lactoylglutathione lyase
METLAPAPAAVVCNQRGCKMAQAQLVFVSIPTANQKRSEEFYKLLFDAQSQQSYSHVSADGVYYKAKVGQVYASIAPRRGPHEPIVCHFAVDNLDDIIPLLKQAGGTLMVPPYELPLGKQDQRIGRGAIFRDPDENVIGIVKIDDAFFDSFKP